MRYWTECREFFRQFREQYFTTGSILPSSAGLARALTAPLRRGANSRGASFQLAGAAGKLEACPTQPRRILEVGPGTGAVTVEILRQLRPGDWLDIVEINGDFVALLERRFAEEPLFQRHRRQTRILHMPLQQIPGEGIY